jgi:S1-C subfamily serine protease
MKKALLALFLPLILYLSTPAFAFDKVDAVVLIQQTKKTEGGTSAPSGHGSGVLISPDRVLTAAHVVRGDVGLFITLHNGKTAHATVIWKHEALDLAVIKLSAPATGVEPAKLACTANSAGDKLTAVGHPQNFRWLSFPWYLAGLDETSPENYAIASGTIMGGMSGGPVYDSQDRVVGIVSAGLDAMPLPGVKVPTTIAAFVPLSADCSVLSVAEKGEKDA